MYVKISIDIIQGMNHTDCDPGRQPMHVFSLRLDKYRSVARNTLKEPQKTLVE